MLGIKEKSIFDSKFDILNDFQKTSCTFVINFQNLISKYNANLWDCYKLPSNYPNFRFNFQIQLCTFVYGIFHWHCHRKVWRVVEPAHCCWCDRPPTCFSPLCRGFDNFTVSVHYMDRLHFGGNRESSMEQSSASGKFIVLCQVFIFSCMILDWFDHVEWCLFHYVGNFIIFNLQNSHCIHQLRSNF